MVSYHRKLPLKSNKWLVTTIWQQVEKNIEKKTLMSLPLKFFFCDSYEEEWFFFSSKAWVSTRGTYVVNIFIKFII